MYCGLLSGVLMQERHVTHWYVEAGVALPLSVSGLTSTDARRYHKNSTHFARQIKGFRGKLRKDAVKGLEEDVKRVRERHLAGKVGVRAR